MNFSIIIPLFNEVEGIAQLHDRLQPVLSGLARGKESLELILVDDGSTDGTAAQLKAFFASDPRVRIFRHEKNRNIGAAIRTGAEAANGDYLFFLDSDCTYAPEILFKIRDALLPDKGLVTASPYHPDGAVEGVPAYRLALSKSLSWIYRKIVGREIYTYTALVRGMPRKNYPRLRSEKNDFSAVAEMMLRAIQQDLSVVEVPATLSVRRFGNSKMKLLRVIWAHLILIRKLLFQPGYFTYENSDHRIGHQA